MNMHRAAALALALGAAPVLAGTNLTAGDTDFINKAAQDGMAEVELGKLAAQQASSRAVKEFGRKMATDHTKANNELKALAKKKGITLPDKTDSSHDDVLASLKAKSGKDFDMAYMRQMVDDHDEDVEAFKKKSSDATDADLRNFAAKTLPTLEHHQQMAKDLKDKQS